MGLQGFLDVADRRWQILAVLVDRSQRERHRIRKLTDLFFLALRFVMRELRYGLCGFRCSRLVALVAMDIGDDLARANMTPMRDDHAHHFPDALLRGLERKSESIGLLGLLCHGLKLLFVPGALFLSARRWASTWQFSHARARGRRCSAPCVRR